MPRLKDEEQKRAKIRELHAANPTMTRRDLAKEVGVSVPFVQSTLKPKEKPAPAPASAERGASFEVDGAAKTPQKPAAKPAPAPQSAPEADPGITPGRPLRWTI